MTGKKAELNRRARRGAGIASDRQPHAGSPVLIEPAAQGMASEHRRGLFPEEGFRWQAGEITRLEAFSDVVFGFALTLLVISLEVPHSYAELMTDLRGFLPFAVCFAQLVAIWRMHYIYSRRYGLEDSYSVLLNTILLFLVLFYVYPLKFVFTLLFARLTGGNIGEDISWHNALVLVRLYFVGFASVYLISTLMYAHAYKLRAKLGLNAVEVQKTRDSLQLNAMYTGAGLLSLALGLKNPFWAAVPCALLGPLSLAHGMIARKRSRLLIGQT